MISSNVTLSTESLDLLRGTKGKKLIGIRTLNEDDADRTYGGCFVLDFDDGISIVLSNDYREINYYHDEVFGDKWEAMALSCKSLDEKKSKRRLYDQKIKSLVVDNIEVITDRVVMHDPEEGELEVVIDAAIVFWSGDKTMTFSLDEKRYDSQWLIRSENKNIDELRPLEGVEYAWADETMRKEDGITAEASRSSRLL